MRETADLAVDPCSVFEIQIGEGVGLRRTRFDLERAQQGFAHQVRWAAAHVGDAEIYVRFAKPDRKQLCVAVGEVQKMHVAEARQVVELCPRRSRAAQRQAAGGGHRQHLQELAPVQAGAAITG